MRISEYKRVARLLKQAYAELEKEALKAGIAPLSEKFQELMNRTRDVVLERAGYSLEEYREAKKKVSLANESEQKMLTIVEDSERNIDLRMREIEDRYVPTIEDIEEIAREIVSKTPPQIINKIVKEVKEPQIIKETIKVDYDDSEIKAKFKEFEEKIKGVEGFDAEALRKEFEDYIAQSFKKNIDIMGMPDFRKLAMGLEARISDLEGSTGHSAVTLAGEDYLSLSGQQITANAIDLDNLSATGTPSGTTYLRGDNTWATIAAGGDVAKVGTPVNNQMAVWTGDGTLEGTSDLTYDGTSLNLITGKNLQIAGSTVLADSAGTTTLSNIDALDATTEATVEAAIDTLANLTSIQGKTVTLADAGANAIFGWDDTAGAYENLTQAEARTVLGLSTAAYVATDLADLNEATIETAIDTLANLTSIQGRTVTLADAGADAIFGWDDSASAYQNLSAADALAALGVTADAAELNYVDGVTSAIQTQLDGKFDLAGDTLTGNLTLGENTSIDLDPALSADGKYSGVCITGTAGATLAFGDLIYLAAADSRWELTDADAATTADRLLGICVLAAASDGDATKILLMGNVRADTAFPDLTIGSPVYVGETAGDVQTTIPTGADAVIRRVGYALTANELYFNPSMDAQTTVA